MLLLKAMFSALYATAKYFTIIIIYSIIIKAPQ